jgi:hypothetical protein
MAQVVDDEESRYGRTESGKLLNDAVIGELAATAEAATTWSRFCAAG